MVWYGCLILLHNGVECEMDGPFEGLLKASPEPLRMALAHLNQ